MKEVKDYLGKRFGRLIIKEINIISPAKILTSDTKVNTKCDCGNLHLVRLSNLEHGNVQSCGCQRKENILKASISHGQSKTPLYATYKQIKYRCYNVKHPAYKDYGGRGIKMCDEWLNDYMVFMKWAIEKGYKPGLQIDRVENNGNYEPDNCQFTTPQVQSKNKRNNVVINVNGIDIKVIEFAKKACVTRKPFYARLYNGWSLERAMNEKPIPGQSLKLRSKC